MHGNAENLPLAAPYERMAIKIDTYYEMFQTYCVSIFLWKILYVDYETKYTAQKQKDQSNFLLWSSQWDAL